MTDTPRKHFPRPTPETRAWWEACRNHELLLQRCTRCDEVQFYPRIVCGNCLDENLEWVRASGQGRVRTFTVVRRPVSAAYADDVPYIVALIELDEGPTMMSNVVGCSPESLAMGAAVEVVFETWSEDIVVPQFQPAPARGGRA